VGIRRYPDRRPAVRHCRALLHGDVRPAFLLEDAKGLDKQLDGIAGEPGVPKHP
jgi:hypothetical protein